MRLVMFPENNLVNIDNVRRIKIGKDYSDNRLFKIAVEYINGEHFLITSLQRYEVDSLKKLLLNEV